MNFCVFYCFFIWFVSIHLAEAYWLMGANNILTTQRIDPVVNPGTVSTHVHSVLGGSNFGLNTTTASLLSSECTSIPILEDKSNYWFPHLYFQWQNGSFTSVDGSAVIYYLFNNTPGATTAFPENFRMISGDPTLRKLNASSFAQQAVTFLCLNFQGTSTKHNELPSGKCPSGIRSQINFPSCWDGKNLDSVDHKSHVSFLSTGPDNGTCTDPDFPITLPRIFMEAYWNTEVFDIDRPQSWAPNQPFVFSNGDPTGYGYHADFINGWEPGVLQRALNECNCNPYGDPTCCVDQNIFSLNGTAKCYISDTFAENTTGTLATLPGNNPVQDGCYENFVDPVTPPIISPVYVYTASTGTNPPPTGTIAVPAQTAQIGQMQPDRKCVRGSSSNLRSMGVVVTSLVVLATTLAINFSRI